MNNLSFFAFLICSYALKTLLSDDPPAAANTSPTCMSLTKSELDYISQAVIVTFISKPNSDGKVFFASIKDEKIILSRDDYESFFLQIIKTELSQTFKDGVAKILRRFTFDDTCKPILVSGEAKRNAFMDAFEELRATHDGVSLFTFQILNEITQKLSQVDIAQTVAWVIPNNDKALLTKEISKVFNKDDQMKQQELVKASYIEKYYEELIKIPAISFLTTPNRGVVDCYIERTLNNLLNPPLLITPSRNVSISSIIAVSVLGSLIVFLIIGIVLYTKYGTRNREW